MDDMQVQIERKLIATQISDWCKHAKGIIFNPALCTQERILRFQTQGLVDIIPNKDKQTSAWNSGCFLMYEIYNDPDDFRITCSVSLKGLVRNECKDCRSLIEHCGGAIEVDDELYSLREWNYPSAAMKMSEIMDALRDFSEVEMPFFEGELEKWNGQHEYRIMKFPDVSQVVLQKDNLPEEILVEGGMKDILTNKYERNLAARKRCIAAYGTACQICGFDFGVVYGPEFAGKIHVHHKVPLHEIKEDYVVDPIKDLIPVCPNCHLVLHSKPGGVYTVEEVKNMI